MYTNLNKSCPKCGGLVRIKTVGEVCDSCGYATFDRYNNASTSISSDIKYCLICQKPLVKQEDGSFVCKDCDYTDHLYSKDEVTQLLEKMNKQIVADNQTEPFSNSPGLYGWICPKCGAVMSPYTDCCPNCTKRDFEITCSTSSTSPTHNYVEKIGWDVNNGFKSFN